MKPSLLSFFNLTDCAPADPRARGPVQDEMQMLDAVDAIAADVVEGRATIEFSPAGDVLTIRKPGGFHARGTRLP